jgi:UDP-glucose-4-epimerase GalE
LNVLVTGGAGYIGSHTAKLLANSGLNPIVYDNFSMGHRWACQWGSVVEGDICDVEAVQRAIREHEIDSVIHFAASAYVGESVTNPRKYFYNNVRGSLSLLDAVVETGVRNVVFSSSCATYGVPPRGILTEAAPQLPVNPYGETKLVIEKALKWYAGAYDLNYAALRYFNAAGADKDGEIGEFHDPETHLIPLAIGAVLGTREALQIFGTDYDTRDGTAERDYVHVEDLAAAHLAALRMLRADSASFSCNLGTGSGTTVSEVLASLEKITGRPVPAVAATRRRGDPPSLVADARLAASLLGWRAKNTLEDMIDDAFRWQSSRARKWTGR